MTHNPAPKFETGKEPHAIPGPIKTHNPAPKSRNDPYDSPIWETNPTPPATVT